MSTFKEILEKITTGNGIGNWPGGKIVYSLTAFPLFFLGRLVTITWPFAFLFFVIAVGCSFLSTYLNPESKRGIVLFRVIGLLIALYGTVITFKRLCFIFILFQFLSIVYRVFLIPMFLRNKYQDQYDPFSLVSSLTGELFAAVTTLSIYHIFALFSAF